MADKPGEMGAEERTKSPTEVFSSYEVAEVLKCNERTASRLMRQGKIAARKVGRSWRTTRRAVLQYLEEK